MFVIVCTNQNDNRLKLGTYRSTRVNSDSTVNDVALTDLDFE